MRWLDVAVQGTLGLKIVFCHLYSKPGQQQNWNSSLLIAAIQNLMYGYLNSQRNKILLAGDLNNNPFEKDLTTLRSTKMTITSTVMMKKDVIPYFNHRRFKILDSYLQDGQTHSLIADDGIKINNDLYSDHLPIIFELDFRKENHGSDPKAS